MKAYARPFNPATDLDAVLSLELRQADLDELAASTGYSSRKAILLSLAASVEAWVVVYKGKIEAVFGVSELVSPTEGLLYVPWFVSTDTFGEWAFRFARESVGIVRRWLDEYGYLVNFVDSRNKASIRWLRWLGFTVDESVGYILRDPNVPFFKFFIKEG